MPSKITSWEYYNLWWKTAFRKAWDAANTISLVVGILVAFLVWLSPDRELFGLQLTWLLPLVAFGPTLLYRLIEAPYLIFKAHESELAESDRKLAEFQAASDHTARHQRMRTSSPKGIITQPTNY